MAETRRGLTGDRVMQTPSTRAAETAKLRLRREIRARGICGSGFQWRFVQTRAAGQVSRPATDREHGDRIGFDREARTRSRLACRSGGAETVSAVWLRDRVFHSPCFVTVRLAWGGRESKATPAIGF